MLEVSNLTPGLTGSLTGFCASAGFVVGVGLGASTLVPEALGGATFFLPG